MDFNPSKKREARLPEALLPLPGRIGSTWVLKTLKRVHRDRRLCGARAILEEKLKIVKAWVFVGSEV